MVFCKWPYPYPYVHPLCWYLLSHVTCDNYGNPIARCFLSVTINHIISSSVEAPTSFSPSKTNQLNLVPSLNIICRKSNREFQWMFSYLLILSHIWWCINSNKTQLWSLDWLVCNFVTPVRDYRTADAWFRCAFGNDFFLSWSHNTWTVFKQTSLPGR